MLRVNRDAFIITQQLALFMGLVGGSISEKFYPRSFGVGGVVTGLFTLYGCILLFKPWEPVAAPVVVNGNEPVDMDGVANEALEEDAGWEAGLRL